MTTMRRTAVRNPFRHLTPDQLREDELSHAQRDLVEAEHNCEYWDSRREMLLRRITRLESQLAPQPQEISHVPLRARA